MPGYQLETSVIERTRKSRDENSNTADALGNHPHLFIVSDSKGMILKGDELDKPILRMVSSALIMSESSS